MPLAQEPSRSVESVSSLVIVDSRGNDVALESPSSKSRKKRKLVKASKGEPKKIKFIASAMPAAESVELCFYFYPECFIVFSIRISLGICITLLFLSHVDHGKEFAYSCLATRDSQ